MIRTDNKTFQQRLRGAATAGNLTVADLAVWMQRPPQTVRTWYNQNRVPLGAKGRAAIVRLELLEWAVDNDPRFPVPQTVTQRQCADHVAGVRDDLLTRIPRQCYSVSSMYSAE